LVARADFLVWPVLQAVVLADYMPPPASAWVLVPIRRTMLRLVDRGAHWIDPPVLDVDEPIPKYLSPYVVANL